MTVSSIPSDRSGRPPAPVPGAQTADDARIASLMPRSEGPVTLVFGTIAYRNTIAEWIEHARRAGCRHFRIVCMDRALVDFLRRHRSGANALHFGELLPGEPLPDFDAMSPPERLPALTPLRVRLFEHLAGNGCDFIHSDADAVWRTDPRPWLGRHADCDLLCSQGTTHPRPHYHRHRFTLCAGFFLCRANDRTRTYFEQVNALAHRHPSDQVRMNAVLLRDPLVRWRIERPLPAVRRKAAWSAPSRPDAFLSVARAVQRHRILRIPANALQRAAKIDWILTSRRIIHGRFSGGLTVGIVPMHIVMRGRFDGWGQPLVFHDSTNKRA